MVGKITRVHLRDVWRHEALDFTKWLEDNIDILNEIVNINLTNVEREKGAGDFIVDLVAEDENGEPVIIENQLERSNHEHLGKIISYLSSLGAKIAIWIVSDARPEHITAISWLNESTAASFYLIKVEAIKIDNSSPAPLLTLIVGPSEEGRAIGVKKKEIAEQDEIRYRFWSLLLDYAKSKTKLHTNISPTTHSWIGTGAGISGLAYNYAMTKNVGYVELYIDRGKDSDDENLAIFKQLFSNKDEIEKKFGGSLEWQELKDRRACRIRITITLGGYRTDEKKWPEIHEAMVDAMIRLHNALSPFIIRVAVKNV
jgi:hypothetical protein